MKKKLYLAPEVAKNELFTLSNLALDVVISNGTIVDDEATKQRNNNFAAAEKYGEDLKWGTVW